MTKSLFRSIFKTKKPIIAMLHIFYGKKQCQIKQALEDLAKLQPHVNGAIVENYGFGYYDSNYATKETADRLFEITRAVMEEATIPIGINVLPNDYCHAFDIAGKTGAGFVQLDHVTGDFKGCRSVNPKDLINVRELYPKVALLGGIHPKYYELSNPNVSISESALKAMALCDAIVVTGERTGGMAKIEDLMLVKHAIKEHPMLIGSGLSAENAIEQLFVADGAIVSTAFKANGVRNGEPVDEEMAKRLMKEVVKLK